MKFPGLRQLALATVALALVGFPLLASASHGLASMEAHAKLQEKLEALAQRAHPGTLGIAVLDLQSNATWRVNAEQAYPMMSVFKAPVGAVVLSKIDRGDISFDQTVILNRAELGSGPIRDRFEGDRMTFTVRQLLTAAVSRSDNSAVDALMKLVGGPAVVTAFLRSHGIEGMRIDMDEAGISQIFDGPAPTATETPKQESERYQTGYQAFLKDPRNRSTPDAAVTFLHKLWSSELISAASTQYLIHLMSEQTVPRRLRAGLPAGVRLADKCGTSYTLGEVTAAYNDIGVLSWPDGHAVIVAAFLTASHASKVERDALFAELAREIVEQTQP